MRKWIRRVRRNLGSIVTPLFLAGCAAQEGFQTRGGGRDVAAPSMSPASEQVLKGFAEIVLTDRRWSSFEEAGANRIAAVVDGSPLYVNIRTARPLGELALPADPAGRYTFSPYPHLYLHVGDDTSLRSLSTCYMTLSPADLGLRELVVPLAPAADRPGGNPTDCWLAVAASARPGTRNYEIRLAGLAARTQTWLPVADLFAVASVEADYRDGTARYAAMLATGSVPSVAQSSPAALLPVPGSAVVPVASGAAASRVPEPSALAPVAATSPAPVEAPVQAPARAPVAAPVAAPPSAPVAAPVPAPPSAPVAAPVPAPAPIIVATPTAPVAARPTQASRQPWARIVIHHFGGDPAAGARARELKDLLAARTDFTVEVRSVASPVSADNIRIFFEADRENAYAARELLAAGPMPIRDFTDYRPLPRPGTIELWLASR